MITLIVVSLILLGVGIFSGFDIVGNARRARAQRARERFDKACDAGSEAIEREGERQAKTWRAWVESLTEEQRRNWRATSDYYDAAWQIEQACRNEERQGAGLHR